MARMEADLPDDDVLRLAETQRACNHSSVQLGVPYRPLLPHKVYGVAMNYIDHRRPHLFSRPTSLRSPSKSDGKFWPVVKGMTSGWSSVLDHCNGLLLCAIELESKLCVSNPATQRWTVLPPPVAAGARHDYAGAYLAFDPAVSPHYEVILIPALPKDGRTTNKQQHQQGDDDDPWRLMEWPPSTWRMKVFSSTSGQWEERDFVRKGEPAGIVQDMRLDPHEPTWRGPRQRYAVYHQGVLYVHCRGSFILRLILSKDKYRVLKTPVYYVNGVKAHRGRVKKIKIPTTDMRGAKPYLGKLKSMVCYGIVYRHQLRIWVLQESCGNMEWLLRYDIDIGLYANRAVPLLDKNGRKLYGSWTVQEDDSHEDDTSDILPEKSITEWDSDNDDIVTLEANGEDDDWGGKPDILGFHPSKNVVFLVHSSFKIAAYHLDCSKFQYLGNSRPQCYYLNYTNGIYESFIYTPCMVGDLLHGDCTRRSLFDH